MNIWARVCVFLVLIICIGVKNAYPQSSTLIIPKIESINTFRYFEGGDKTVVIPPIEIEYGPKTWRNASLQLTLGGYVRNYDAEVVQLNRNGQLLGIGFRRFFYSVKSATRLSGPYLEASFFAGRQMVEEIWPGSQHWATNYRYVDYTLQPTLSAGFQYQIVRKFNLDAS